jgi:UDPglucose 6-dehydrogenase
MARIAFFGAGYAGLVSGACLADLGHTVVIRDVVPERIEALQAGKMPFHEPGLGELVAKNAERLSFTLSTEEAVAGSEFLFVCVGTPPTPSPSASSNAPTTMRSDSMKSRTALPSERTSGHDA